MHAIDNIAKELGLTMKAEFVPWSQSRNAKEKNPSLNWRVTIYRDARPILTTDYSARCAHAPSYKQGDNSMSRHQAVVAECETGKPHQISAGGRPQPLFGSKPPIPDFADVLYSLANDADVLNYSGFEDWASSFGYDADSRKAEAIYQACLDIALKLRNSIGDDKLASLQEACQDY